MELRSWTRDIELTRESWGRATQQCKKQQWGERQQESPIANHADAGKGKKSQPTEREREKEKRKKEQKYQKKIEKEELKPKNDGESKSE